MDATTSKRPVVSAATTPAGRLATLHDLSNPSQTPTEPDKSAETILRLQALLYSLQWSGATVITPTHRQSPTCPACRAFDKHEADCRLAAEFPANG